MSSILDSITGGGLLPHVYCKKIALEHSENGSDTKVTLSLRIYQEKNALENSAWLNSFDIGGQNFMDSIYIQILPLTHPEHVKKLEPTHKPLEAGQNIFTAKYFYGDNFLPRRTPDGTPSEKWSKFDSNKTRVFNWSNEQVQSNKPPEPIQISNSSLLGGNIQPFLMP